MKKLIILTLFSVSAILSLNATNKSGIDEIILQVQNLSPEQNIEILTLFKNDPKVQVINTCSVLGLIVFDSVQDENSSRLETEAYIKFKIQRVFSDKTLVVQKDISKGKVNQLCREKVAALNSSN